MTILNMKTYNCLILFILLRWSTGSVDSIFAQDKGFSLPVQSKGDLLFDADVCQYEGKDNLTLIEILYHVDGGQLFDSHQSDSVSVLQIDIKVIGMDLSPPVQWRETKRIRNDKTTDEKDKYTFIDLKRFQQQPMTVVLEMTISDSASGREGTITNSFDILDFSKGLSISDLHFVSHLQRGKGENPFEKNGLLMVPNVLRYYTVRDSSQKAYVYYEINGMDFKENAISYYDTYYFIYSLSGEEMASQTKEFILKKGPGAARIEVVPLRGLKTGVYRFSVLVTDRSLKKSVRRDRYFRISGDDEHEATLLPMSDTDIEKYTRQIQYIVTNEEKKLFKRLNPRGKQAFLLDFWRSKDPTPGTVENEFMMEHFKKLDYAEKNFRGGVDSDRGRIYMQYGPPMDVQRELSHIEYEKPVEIWTYALDGRIEFIFVDRSGDNQYVLVHSTHVDEFNNPNWMDELID